MDVLEAAPIHVKELAVKFVQIHVLAHVKVVNPVLMAVKVHVTPHAT